MPKTSIAMPTIETLCNSLWTRDKENGR